MTEDRASKGGKARAEALSPERRSEIARQAAQSRSRQLTEEGKAALPQATHRGPLRISADLVLPSAVLSDGTRVIAETAVARELGRGLGGKSQRLAERARGEGEALPAYLTTALEAFVPESLRVALNHPISYRDRGGVRRAINAALLPEICDVWLRASDAGVLQKSQYKIAERALVLRQALSKIGIIALVDEATGYQEVRERDELQRLLALYVNPEYLPWTKRFPNEFYQELFRLNNWAYNSASFKRPQVVGKLTDQLIYEKLPPGILEDLRTKNPMSEGGSRKHKHHQFLTSDIGHPHLEKQLVSVMTLMRASKTWKGFKKLFARAYGPPQEPAPPMFAGMEYPEDEDE